MEREACTMVIWMDNSPLGSFIPKVLSWHPTYRTMVELVRDPTAEDKYDQRP
jgi:hypothetical protein